jgi:NitT/TauT family transport system ATP-binding protein
VSTIYPKCSPSEMMGLLVLLNGHKGSEDVALLADDLDLEIDEILPSLDFAGVLGLVKVTEGRATLTELGKKLLAGTIRDRKTILRDQLRKTTLFKALLRALESAPDRQLSEEEMVRLIAFTTAPADELVLNIVNWGRFTELFRYDPNEHILTPVRHTAPSKTAPPPPTRPPPSIPSTKSGAASSSAGGRAPAAKPTQREESAVAASA